MGRRDRGSGTVRKRSDGRWEGRILVGYDEKGLPKTKNVLAKTKMECEAKLEKLKSEIGIVRRDKVTPNMLFGEWIDFWYQNYKKLSLRPSTQASYENIIYNHIIPEIGKIVLERLNANDLEQFYARMKKGGRLQYKDTLGEGVSDRMVRMCHAHCRSALEKAVEDGIVHTNVAVGCKIPPKKAKEMKVLTEDEMQRFLIQAKYDGYFEICLLALTTGMRRGEIMGLQWQDLDFESGKLEIRRQAYYLNGKMATSEPKTKTSVRTIKLPEAVLNVLKRLKEKTDSRWMFPSPVVDDVPRNPNTMQKKIRKVLERADCKRIRFHDLRHTFATTALANGMDIKTLSSIIGHVSSSTTLDIYLHSTDKMQKEAAKSIDRGIRGVSKDSGRCEEVNTDSEKTSRVQKFEPVKGKYRKPGTGCVSKINDNLWEGRYTPTVNGKRMARNVYAHTEEECEEKLAQMINDVKIEIEKLKQGG